MILKFLRYLLHDYAMKEKEEMDRLETILRQGKIYGRERKNLEELANWHFENYMEAVKEGGIPWCVRQYLFGYRRKPEPREIYEEFLGRVQYWKGLRIQKEKAYKIIAAGAALAALVIVLKVFLQD